MSNQIMDLTIACPWCGRGETLADQRADIRITCRCNNCQRFYSIDFQTLRAKRTKAKARGHPKEQNRIIMSCITD